ncbi:MAG: hypothetical protein KBT32_03200 [Bacteroidales bacterium]|nr:hypothetical protein [Candidatus Physcocola equi]
MKKEKKQIAVTKDVREFLSTRFNVTSVTVWKALTFNSDSELAKKIRNTAIQCGGIEFIVAPACDFSTFHDHDGYLRQYFNNGALIELSKVDSHGDVLFNGELLRHYDEVRIDDIPAIQQYAMSLS